MSDNPRNPQGQDGRGPQEWDAPELRVGERRRRAESLRGGQGVPADGGYAGPVDDEPDLYDHAGEDDLDQEYLEDEYIEDDWIDYDLPRQGPRRWLVAFGVVAVILVLVAGAAFVWVQGKIDPSGPPGAELELQIAQGSTTADIGDFLADNDVITSGTVWDYWTRLQGKGPFQAGVYVFQENSSFDEAVAVLDAGPKPPTNVSVTIPEGLTVAEIVGRLGDPEFAPEWWTTENLQAAIDSGQIQSSVQPAGASLEGLLFPSTYEVDEDVDEATFLSRLVTQMENTLTELNAESGAANLGLSTYEVLVVASLIEEEAKVEEERFQIARVIYNRLQQGIPLGIDATSRYEAEISGRSRDDIDFESDSPYNTRRIAGLPPTPIAAPGRASIEAALSPADGPWIYYVASDAEGHHLFTDSAAEFQEAKQRCIEQGLGCG